MYKIGQENKLLDDEDIARLLVQQSMKASKYEQEFKRPLKISRNVFENNINILPFPITLQDKQCVNLTKYYHLLYYLNRIILCYYSIIIQLYK